MPLQGTFDVLPFADLLELLGGRAATGRLHVRSRATGANIYLDKGHLVGAEVGEHTSASPDDVHGRLGEVCFELLEAERGSFEFNPDLTGMGLPTIDLEVGEVLKSARDQLEEWRDIQTVVPSLDLHPGLVAELAADEVTLSRTQWRVLSALDSRRSVRAVARLLDLSDYNVSRTLKSLIQVGVVELDALVHPAPMAGREVTVLADDAVAWAEPNGNGDRNGSWQAAKTPPMASEPIASKPLVSEPIAPERELVAAEPTESVAPEPGVPAPAGAPVAAAASANGDSDSIWRGNVEDRPALTAEPPAPPTPPPPFRAPAPRVPTTVPIRQAAPPPTSANAKVRRPGFFGLGRKNPPSRPNS
jgi:hypothetical protein